MNFNNMHKTSKLVWSVLFDVIGYVSFVFPFFDILWAPASAYLMTKMYKGQKGKIAAAIVFIEEALPMLDFIPTFSLMWLYSYVLSNQKTEVI